MRAASRRWCAVPHPYDRVVSSAYVSVWRRSLRSRHLARRATALGVGERGQRRPVRARVGNREDTEGDIKPLSEFRFGQSVPESFVFSRDGRYLYGSSYYTGVSNIFRYEVATGAVEAVSNAEIGFFRPVPLADGQLVVLKYTGEGFVPATIDPRPIADVSAIKFLGTELAEKYPVRQDLAGARPPSSVDDEKLVTGKGPYLPAAQRRARRTPTRCCRATRTTPGSAITSTSTIRCSSQASASRPPTRRTAGLARPNESGHVDITGRYQFWTAELSWNRSDFYDLFGPTKRSRKGYAAKVGYDWEIYNDEPRKLDLFLDFAYYDKIDTLPNAQNVETNFTRLVTGEARLNYTDVKRSIGAVDDEKGIAWELDYLGSRVNGQVTPQVRGGLDLGLRASAGELVDLVANRRRLRQRGPQQYGGQFLLRRFRQQLRRRQIGQALSKVRFVPRVRNQPDRRTEFRARHGRMESAALRFRIGRYAELLSQLAAAVRVRSRIVGGPRQLGAAQELHKCRRVRWTFAFRSCIGTT